MCCCCDCPEVERTCWKWSVEKGSKCVAVIYMIEGILILVHTLFLFFAYIKGYKIESQEGFHYFLLIFLSLFCTLYLIQIVSSALLLVGLTVKENTAFIRIFLIFNYFFIGDDVIQFILYLLMWGTNSETTTQTKNPAAIEIIDVLTALLGLIFSIYSHILVSSHYKQVRRAITGPVQTSPEQDEGFVNKYLRF